MKPIKRAARRIRGAAMASWACLFLCGACGPPAARRIRPSSPYLAQHASFLDDNIDLIRDPEGLGGRWASEWATDLRGRIGYADLIARVRVESITVETDAEQRRRMHINAHVMERHRGRVPTDRKVTLLVAEGTESWQAVSEHEDELLSGRFIAFIKWFTDGQGEIRNHWHLSPSSQALAQTIRTAIEDLAADSARSTSRP